MPGTGFAPTSSPTKRRPRGYAYQALAFAAAATVANMRRIVTFIANAAKKTLTKAQFRARRRIDEHRTRLPHHTQDIPSRTNGTRPSEQNSNTSSPGRGYLSWRQTPITRPEAPPDGDHHSRNDETAGENLRPFRLQSQSLCARGELNPHALSGTGT